MKENMRCVNCFYDHEDYGLLLGWAFRGEEFICRDKDDEEYSIDDMSKMTESKFNDWPHLAKSNPKLPYSFDLLFDYKRPSEVVANVFGADMDSMLETTESHIKDIEHWGDPEPGSPLEQMKDWYYKTKKEFEEKYSRTSNGAFHLPDGSVTKDAALAAEQWAEVSFKLRDALREISNLAEAGSSASSLGETAQKALDLCPESII